MYMSHQALRTLSRDRMTAAQQREADERLGRIVAGLSWSRGRFAERTRALATALAPARPRIGKLSKGRSAESGASGR